MEQGKVDEARRGPEQECDEGNMPWRMPRAGNGAAGKPGGAAAEEPGDQDNRSDALAGVEFGHLHLVQRVWPSR